MARKFWKEISLISGLLILYRDSFFSRFFQDDFILSNIAKTRGLLEPISNFPYRPVSIQLFYSLSPDPFILHLLMFLFFLGGLYFVYRLTRDWFVVYLLAFNISLFPLFYWVATSYFVFVFFAFFACAYFYQKKKTFLSLLFFIFGLLSNELAVVFPLLLSLLSLRDPIAIGSKQSIFGLSRRKLLAMTSFFVISLIYFPFRLLISPFPKVPDYQVDISLRFFATARWYALRILNLPEGIRNNNLILVLFVLLGLLVLLNIKNFKLKYFIFGATWFLIGALPFYFLPGHMSAYYLTIALFGPMVFLSEFIKKFRVLFLTIYLLMSFLGLEFLKISHWIILKP